MLILCKIQYIYIYVYIRVYIYIHTYISDLMLCILKTYFFFFFLPVHKYLLSQKVVVSSLIHKDFGCNISNTGDGNLMVSIIIVFPTFTHIPDPKK